MAERMNNLTGKEWLQKSFTIWRKNAKWQGCWCADKTPCEYHNGWRDGYEHLQEGDTYADASAEAFRVRLREEYLSNESYDEELGGEQ